MEREPSQVWMVNRRTGPNGAPGWLFLRGDRLVFRHDDERAMDVEFPLQRIRAARRVRGSPVLEVTFVQPHEFRVMGFYFIRPPSLAREESKGFMFKRRAARKESVLKLRAWNPLMKEEIAGWVEAIYAARVERAKG